MFLLTVSSCIHEKGIFSHARWVNQQYWRCISCKSSFSHLTINIPFLSLILLILKQGILNFLWTCTPQHFDRWACMQAHNKLGTPGGVKSFLGGAQIFWTSNSFKQCPTHFSRGAKIFLGRDSPPWSQACRYP